MKKSFLLSCLWMLLGLTNVFAQIQDPVQFKAEWKNISDTEAQIVFTGVIDAGWHVYSTDLPEGGPISATFNIDKMEGIELVGKLTPEGMSSKLSTRFSKCSSAILKERPLSYKR